MKPIPSASLVLSCLLLTASSLSAATLVFQESVSPTGGYTTAGVTIRSDQPTTNQQVGAGNIVLGNLANGSDLRAVFAFDLSAIGAIGSATIDSVTLSWRGAADSSTSTSLQIDLFALAQSFGETTVTWNTYNGTNAWASPGGDFPGPLLASQSGNPFTGVNSSTGTVNWTFGSSTAFINAAQSAFNSGGQTLYLIAKLNNESAATRQIFQIVGDENATGSFHPALTVNYTAVPEPSSSLLLALGVGLCLARRTEKRPLK